MHCACTRKIHKSQCRAESNSFISLLLFFLLLQQSRRSSTRTIEVLPTQLIPGPGDDEGKVLRVKLIMKEGVEHFAPVYLFDEGSTVNWIPCGRKLSCSYPGIRFAYGFGTYFGHEVIN